MTEIEDKNVERVYNPHALSPESVAVYESAIDTIVLLHAKVPLSLKYILEQATRTIPYYKRETSIHLVYTKCLLLLADRLPDIKRDLLSNIIHRYPKYMHIAIAAIGPDMVYMLFSLQTCYKTQIIMNNINLPYLIILYLYCSH